jgi:hypothetical protein
MLDFTKTNGRRNFVERDGRQRMTTPVALCAEVVRHLGGEARLKEIGPVQLDAFVARPLGRAEEIAPDSLASVLGELTVVESLRHHY